MIYQEFFLIPELTVYENIFLGKEIRGRFAVDKKEMIRQTNNLYRRLNITMNPLAALKDLSVAQCQLVEIGKAVKEKAKIIIMDEPTAALTEQEAQSFFGLISELKAAGVTIIYISHRLEEMLELTDRITVMRDGCIIKTVMTKETNRNDLIKMMIGRELQGEFPKRYKNQTEQKVILKAACLKNKCLKDISFEVHSGEILGLAGLVGAGRTEIGRAIFGADILESGDIFINGKKCSIRSPMDAIKHGIALIPEDRKRQGVNLDQSIGDNLCITTLKKRSHFLTINAKKERGFINECRNMLRIKMDTANLPVSSLSGGNQQKVVLCKWLATMADIFIFDEPTRGIDIGAKKEIYEIINDLRNQGKGIIMISSEMLEVLGLCDRIIVLHEGKVTGELRDTEATQEAILRLAAGGD